MNNPYLYPSYVVEKNAGIMDSISNAMPTLGGALGGLGAGAGLGQMIGGPGKMIAPIIGAAMGAYAASKVDNAMDQNANNIDMNSQLATLNGQMNLQQQDALMGQGAGYGQMAGRGYGPGQGMMDGSGMQYAQNAPYSQNVGMGPGQGMGYGQMAGVQAPSQVASGQNAMTTMQKRSAVNSISTDARAKVFAYFNQ